MSGEATQELIERIAFIRNTHYGMSLRPDNPAVRPKETDLILSSGGFWQFTADLAKKDSAYTQLALGAHTDTTYFSDPAGLQTFHLLSHTDGDGGSSLLVDGFKVAETLRRESPEAYETLCRVRIRGHASGNEKVKVHDRSCLSCACDRRGTTWRSKVETGAMEQRRSSGFGCSRSR